MTTNPSRRSARRRRARLLLARRTGLACGAVLLGAAMPLSGLVVASADDSPTDAGIGDAAVVDVATVDVATVDVSGADVSGAGGEPAPASGPAEAPEPAPAAPEPEPTPAGTGLTAADPADLAPADPEPEPAPADPEPDVTGPSISIDVAPEPESGWYDSYLGIWIVAGDPSGISSVHWDTSGAVATNGDVYDESYGAFDLTFDGVTTIRAWAYDGLGNYSDAEPRTIRIDTVQPTITVNSPALPESGVLEVEQGSVVPLEYSCDDEHSGVVSCIDHGELPLTASATAVRSTLPTSELGPQTRTIRALDLAGNESVTEIDYTVVPAKPGGGNGGAGGGNGGAGGGGTGGNGGTDTPASGPVRTPRTGSPGTLAETGIDPAPGLGVAAALLLAGGLATAVRRRIRTDAP